MVATEVPSVENGGILEDGLVYTFKLRKDVTWNNNWKLKPNSNLPHATLTLEGAYTGVNRALAI